MDVHLSLLKRLRGQKSKIQRLQFRSQGDPEALSTVNPALQNHRDLFEAGLLRILARNELEDESISLLPPELVQELYVALGELFAFLDEVANEQWFLEVAVPAKPYTRLDCLLHHVDSEPGPFDLAKGTTRTLFRLDNLAAGIAARTVVKQVNRILDGLQTRSSNVARREAVSSSQTTAAPFQGRLELISRRHRANLGKVLDVLQTEFTRCQHPGGVASHHVALKLFDVLSSLETELDTALDIFILCPQQGKWQNARCHFDREQYRDSLDGQKLCLCLKSSLRREEGLMLIFESALFRKCSRPFGLPSFRDPASFPKLGDLMQKQKVFAPAGIGISKQDTFSHPERRALAAKLAMNLLVFCAWQHTSKSWDGNVISFSGLSETAYDKAVSYISCHVGRNSSTELETDEDDAPVPSFTEFAKLLLEIEYGSLPDGDFGPGNDFGWKHVRDFHRGKEAYDDESRRQYLDAVDACLRFDTLYRTARATASGRLETLNETSRKVILTHILSKLVSDLPGFKSLPRKRPRPITHSLLEDDCISDSDSEVSVVEDVADSYLPSQKPAKTRKRARVANRYSDVSTDSVGGLKLVGRHSRSKYVLPAIHQKLASVVHRIEEGSIFDSQSSNVAPETASSASRWFSMLTRDVHPVLEEKRRTGDRPIKVAILDTGIDRTNPRIQEHLEAHGSTIQECRDWADSPSGVGDLVGHGTAVCDVLLRVAKVQLYVGKVTDAAILDTQAPKRIAEAILHASNTIESGGWDVDIIVLSLGFEREDDDLRKAVQVAFTRDKLVFVAASNSGSLDPASRVSYPARVRGQVLSIRSAVAFGRRADASPSRSVGDDNFAILGEGIEAAWPAAHNGGRPTRFVSGTSFATPLAAGIAALLLEFSFQRDKRGSNLHPEAQALLKTYRGMRQLFLYMSTVPDQDGNPDCRIIYPWNLFNSRRMANPNGIPWVITDQLNVI